MIFRIARVFAFSFALFEPARAGACSCVGGIPLCQSVWMADAVFSAEVLSIEPISSPGGDQFLANRRIKARVIQAWRGGVEGIVELTTGSGGGDCGYNFLRGESYLVYAYARAGGLTASTCSRTRLLTDAARRLAPS